ncbi:MAG: hypothetical protein LC734_01800 [Acidobacteria bacterium]|nr:hypothetical protein [Acidobacteriota bacterium]
MKHIIGTNLFAAVFFTSYFAFFVVTIFVLNIQRPGVGLGHTEYGFPFGYYYDHCFRGYYIWTGLVTNMVIAAVISALVGIGVGVVRSKVSSPAFRAKWYL